MPRVFKKKIHASWFIAWTSLGILVGIWLANFSWTNNFAQAGWLFVGALLLFITFTKRVAPLIILALVAGTIIGLWRGANTHIAANYHPYIGRTIYLHGTVTDDATHKNNEAGLKLSNVQIDGHKFGGEVWAGTTSKVDFKRSDQVTLLGKLKPGFGSFAASMSYAKFIGVVRPTNGHDLRTIRDQFEAGLQRAIPQPEANLGIGYLTGQHNNISPDLIQQLQLVGLIHLVIAGGYNVTILVRFTRRKLSRASKYLALLGASSVLLGMALITGFVAPMSRTVVVTGISLATWYYGLKIHPLVLLPFSAALTALVSPNFVWGDVGWYLTFVAYGGLIILGPQLKKYFWGSQTSEIFKQILVDTLSVQIVTMPILALAFHQYSIYGLLANLLVLPLMPLTMLATALAGVSGIFLPVSAAQIIGWPAAHLLGYTYKVTVWLANAPGANATANFISIDLLPTYALIMLTVYWLWRKTHYNFRAENIIE